MTKLMSIRKKANYKMLRNLFFFFALIIFTFWFIFKDQDLGELFKTMGKVDIKFVILGAFLMFLTYLCEANNIRSVLVALGEKKLKILTALKLTWIGFFFSAITPSATGGQPAEVYYMTKENIKGANGTMAMLLQLCGFQISTLTISIICAITNPYLLKDGIIWFYLLGFILNGIVLTIMLLCIFSKKITIKLANGTIKLFKLAKLKNVDKLKDNLFKGIEEYNESSKFIKKHPVEFIKAISRVFIQIIIYYSIPYCIYKAFGLNDYSYFQVFSMQAILYTTISGIPLPGSIGASESLFLKIFGLAFSKKLLNSAMLLCRGVNFYLYIVISAVVVMINAVKTKDVVGEIDKKVHVFEETAGLPLSRQKIDNKA